MSEYDYDEYAEDPLQAAYEADPAGTLSAIAAAGAQQGADLAYQQGLAANAAVVTSQAALTFDAIDKDMSAKYGQEWEDHKPEVQAVLDRNPHLLPANGSILDPFVLGRSMEDALEIARGIKKDNYANSRWSQIQNADSAYSDLKKTLGGL
jgi:hypothetical protein